MWNENAPNKHYIYSQSKQDKNHTKKSTFISITMNMRCGIVCWKQAIVNVCMCAKIRKRYEETMLTNFHIKQMNKRYQCLSILQMDWKPEMNLSMHNKTHSVIIICVDFSLQITIGRCICCLRKDFSSD